jgi:hypothetical protein
MNAGRHLFRDGGRHSRFGLAADVWTARGTGDKSGGPLVSSAEF